MHFLLLTFLLFSFTNHTYYLLQQDTKIIQAAHHFVLNYNSVRHYDIIA